jgi:hypothetical protein
MGWSRPGCASFGHSQLGLGQRSMYLCSMTSSRGKHGATARKCPAEMPRQFGMGKCLFDIYWIFLRRVLALFFSLSLLSDSPFPEPRCSQKSRPTSFTLPPGLPPRLSSEMSSSRLVTRPVQISAHEMAPRAQIGAAMAPAQEAPSIILAAVAFTLSAYVCSFSVGVFFFSKKQFC